MYQLPQCRMLLWLGMYFCSPWIFAMLQGVGALDTPKPAWKLPSKMGSSTLHRVLLVKYLVHPMAYRRARWIRDLYAAYFGDVAFYGDSNWCFNRGGHRACYGPPNAARSFLGRFGIFQNLQEATVSFLFKSVLSVAKDVNPVVQSALQHSQGHYWSEDRKVLWIDGVKVVFLPPLDLLAKSAEVSGFRSVC